MLHAVQGSTPGTQSRPLATWGFGLAGALFAISSVALVPNATAQSTPSAYVYVQSQGSAGPVYGYSASSAGKLTAISGSPFKPGTQIVGGNGSQFFTLGHTLIHSYAVSSNGAIGSQQSQIGMMNYGGGSCGGTAAGDDGAVLDHSGKYIYVLLQWGGDASCSAYQTYKINSDGSFTFVGDTEENWGDQSGEVNPSAADLPSILGNESFAYADQTDGHQANPIGFKRLSSGELQSMQFSYTQPVPPSNGYWVLESPDASPTENFVVFQLYANDSNPPYLASYSVDASGNISTTNTVNNMPVTQLDDPGSKFSPDGGMIALNGGSMPAGSLGNGIEIYNFNGATPLTLNTRFLNGTPVDEVAWDTSHHLYAISRTENKLWVFSVTPSSVAQDAVLSITSPLSLVVVSKSGSGGACPAPTNPGVNVCAPGEGATVTSPVAINAAANVTGGVFRFELWNGSTKLVSVDNSGIMDQTVSLAPGNYTLTFAARNSSGTHEYATRDITVK